MADLLVFVNRLFHLVPRNDDAANRHREEQGLPLDRMDVEGVRHRPTPGQHPPTSAYPSARTANEVLVSGSGEELPQVQEDAELKDSFVKINLRRISTTFASRKTAEEKKTEERLLYEQYGYHKLRKEDYQKAPDGFPRLAAFVSSDDDYEICRGFKTLHNRLICHREVELTELERRLAELDKSDENHPVTGHRLRRIKHKEGWDEEQNKLMDEIDVKLKEYDELVQRHAQMQARGRPPQRAHRSLYHWILQNKPLARGYWDFILYEDDFVTINGNSSNYFETFLQDRLQSWPWKYLKPYLVTDTEREKTKGGQVEYYSASLLKIWGGILLVLTTVCILLAPVFLLFLIPMSRSLMVITASIFIVLFSAVVSVVTGAEVYKVFVSTATYSAIVVVFLGNVSAGTGPATP
ncbi:hypothetical protein BKA64DRAFT_705362 [Cadophora sp. MPI-SDFR-AT-0126]|nr:hypothetical protein BKA64DRAFT_705362 [Leotiomycetes sp. MPI-SDFR-AT-0126]